MSDVRFELSDSLRQPLTGTTPNELCNFLGGTRVINKVIIHFVLFFFPNYFI